MATKTRTETQTTVAQASIPAVIPWWQERGFASESEADAVLRAAAVQKEAKVNAELTAEVLQNLAEGVTVKDLMEWIYSAETRSKSAGDILIKVNQSRPLGRPRTRIKNAGVYADRAEKIVIDVLRGLTSDALIPHRSIIDAIVKECPALNEKQAGRLSSRLLRSGVFIGTNRVYGSFSGSKANGSYHTVIVPVAGSATSNQGETSNSAE